MLNSLRSKTSCEEEAKFLQNRIQLVEKHLADLCDVFGQYARKTARLRDKGDEISKSVISYSAGEKVNRSLSIGLDGFAAAMSTLSDYGDARTRGLELKVGELSKYEDICKRAREEVRDIFAAREREFQRKKQLDRIRDKNPRNRQQIMQAETEVAKATAELSKTLHNIEEKSSTFEKQKLHDLKEILLDFVRIEMGFHARSLEVLTDAFSLVHGINEDSDLEEFKRSLRLPESIHRSSPGARGALLRSTQSLGAIFSSSHTKRLSKDRVNKSQDTLDSIKHNRSGTEESDSETVESDDDEEEESSMEIRKMH